jgi:hypothetical protein
MLIKDNNKTKSTSSEPMEQDQPDAGYIKMSVGQVPRSMDEAQLRKNHFCVKIGIQKYGNYAKIEDKNFSHWRPSLRDFSEFILFIHVRTFLIH